MEKREVTNKLPGRNVESKEKEGKEEEHVGPSNQISSWGSHFDHYQLQIFLEFVTQRTHLAGLYIISSIHLADLSFDFFHFFL